MDGNVETTSSLPEILTGSFRPRWNDNAARAAGRTPSAQPMRGPPPVLDLAVLPPLPDNLPLVRAPPTRTTGKYKGVYRCKNYWMAQFHIKGKAIHLMHSKKEKKAALAVAIARWLKNEGYDGFINSRTVQNLMKRKKEHTRRAVQRQASKEPMKMIDMSDDVEDAIPIKMEDGVPLQGCQKKLQDFTFHEIAAYIASKGQIYQPFATALRKAQFSSTLLAKKISEGEEKFCDFLQTRAGVEGLVAVQIYDELATLSGA